MKSNATTIELVTVTCMLAPLVYLGLVWNQLPTEIVSHYDLQGHPNGRQNKETLAFMVGNLSVILYLVLRFLPRIDPKEQLQTANYQKLRLVVAFFWGVIMGGLIYMEGHQVSNEKFLSLMLASAGLMLAGMGNYLTTVKPNWFVGIRTPWTLGNDVVWRKTHRLGGRLMVVGGLLSALLALVIPNPYRFGSILGVMFITVIIPVVYSYIYFRREKAHRLN